MQSMTSHTSHVNSRLSPCHPLMATDADLAMALANSAENVYCSVSSGNLIKKKPNWTELEKKVLVEEVHKRETVLFGKFKGPGGGKAAKDSAWAEIAGAVNGVSGAGMQRTGGEASKQYSNLKQRAKGKLSEMKRPKTGGGPKPPSPSVAEQCILDCLEGRPSLEGIAGGIDTADPASEVCGPPSILKKKDESEDRSKPSSKKRKTTTQDLEEKTLTLEHEKMREEIQKIKLEREVLELKKSYYNLKVQMFVNEHPEVVAQILPVHEV